MTVGVTESTARGRSRWRASLVGALAVALALLAAMWTLRGAAEYPAPYDPQNPGPDGAQALARVLGDQGVDVTVARSADALAGAEPAEGSTVVVTSTEALSPGTLDRLLDDAGAARVVLVDPPDVLLDDQDDQDDQDGLDLDPRRVVVDDPVEADCAASTDTDLSGLAVEVDSATAYDAAGCFATDDGSLLVATELDGRPVLLLGAAQALTNEQVTRADNAAVALRLLGADERLVWYVPDPADALGGETVSLGSLVPDWVVPAVWMLLIAATGLIVWRARRFGALAVEPLPVVVRAAETTLSRGRMYRRAGDRAHAAAALRRATRADLADHLRIERGASERALSLAVAAHLGVDVAEVAPLLEDSPQTPPSDADLVRLAEDLARISREVRSR